MTCNCHKIKRLWDVNIKMATLIDNLYLNAHISYLVYKITLRLIFSLALSLI